MNTFIRFIYVYREKSTGRAVYVGSAFDPEQRDRQHSNGDGLPFDRELKRRGRDAFTFHIVEALSAPTAWAAEKAGAARENHWMDVLKTFRTEGCFNFARSRCFKSEELREASIAAMKLCNGTLEARAANSAAMKKHYENPEVRARKSAARKAYFEDPEARARQSAAMKAALSTPEARARHAAAQTNVWAKRRAVLFLCDALISEIHSAAQHQSENCSKPPSR